MALSAVILDGYVDEPTCLGVPPYISPYIRAIAGVLSERGYVPDYHTIDQVRKRPLLIGTFHDASLFVMIAGVTVPGKYLGGTPASLTEVQQVGGAVHGPVKLVGGPIGMGYSPGGGTAAVSRAISGYDALLPGPPAEALNAFLDGLLAPGDPPVLASYRDTDRWVVIGSGVVTRHPNFPFVVCEVETGRGCPRSISGGCSFCTEPRHGSPRYRTIAAITSEVAALSAHGARHFRLGMQPDLLVYGTAGGEYPVPRPDTIWDLFAGVREAAPSLATLHIDNVNPGTIARHPEESREALCAIISHHTAGDVAALGMETADPEVVAANNLKASPDQVRSAIMVINEVGAVRHGGLPEILPGLNFVCGLSGETALTYDRNEAFLKDILDSGLLVRRINIRQLMPFPDTPAFDDNTLGLHDARFRRFKEFVRAQIDHPMIQKVAPQGTVLSDVVISLAGQLSLGRQMGSYPLLVGIPLSLFPGSVTDVVVVAWGSRSVTGLPVPIEINTLPISALRWVPGIGKRGSGIVAVKRPFSSLHEIRALVGATPLEQFYHF
ncbi:MAG: radical SAM protein [Methanomicrobiales archaeon]|nr:radical SAM protein [Methanomicrobiales archaeon]